MGVIAATSITKVNIKLAHKTRACVKSTTPTGLLKNGIIKEQYYFCGPKTRKATGPSTGPVTFKLMQRISPHPSRNRCPNQNPSLNLCPNRSRNPSRNRNLNLCLNHSQLCQ